MTPGEGIAAAADGTGRGCVRFRILGPLTVQSAGREVSLGGPKQRALLAYLILHPGRIVSRDALVDALWGEVPPASAEHAVQVYVSNLRKVIEPPIESRTGGYLFATEDGDVDAWVFERLSQQGRRMLAAGEADAAARTLRDALRLWRDRPLADLSEFDFARSEAARLEELHLATLEDRIEADLALGRHTDVAAELHELTASHPFREGLRRQLMLALYRTGRQTEALDSYREWRRTMLDELGLEPGPQARELEAAILRQDPGLDIEPPELRARRHLPGRATALIGRRTEIERATELVRGGARLVTLTGPGGVGKTRIALQAAHELAASFPDGVFFVPLASLRDTDLVPSAIASTIGLQEAADSPLAESLRAHLRHRSALLVLDNFEHVDEAALIVADLLASAARLAILVTSRTRLDVYGEHEYGIPPMSDAEAVALFEARFAAVDRGKSMAAWDVAAVRDLCRHLDGLPLAIEFAAARARELSPTEMLGTLPARLALESRGPRDLPARQRTLSATVGWSLELLDEEHRRLFERMGVVAGGCDRAAAEEIFGVSRDALASLVDANLLMRDPVTDRYSMLQTVREVANDRLEETGEADVVRRQHAEYFAAMAAEGDRALRGGGDQAAWLEKLSADHDNFRVALHWSSEHAPELALSIAAELAGFWAVRGHLTEGRMLLGSVLAAPSSSPRARGKALVGCGVIARIQGDLDSALTMFEESLRIHRELEDPSATVRSAQNLAYVESSLGDLGRAQELYEEGLAIARTAGNRRDMLVIANGLADLAIRQREYERALRHAEEAYELSREANDRESLAVSAFNQAHAALGLERYEDAVLKIGLGLRGAQELGDLGWAVTGLEALAAVLTVNGFSRQAARFLGLADALRNDLGVTLEFFDRVLRERTVESLRRNLDERELEAAFAEGRLVEQEQVFAETIAAVEALAGGRKTYP
ncbi:MAG: tetratricopeptide repeat protein [Chloroflexi bacterium]|nr:tetratricopeptide repeat protein [Chloroflexota bacterium]